MTTISGLTARKWLTNALVPRRLDASTRYPSLEISAERCCASSSFQHTRRTICVASCVCFSGIGSSRSAKLSLFLFQDLSRLKRQKNTEDSSMPRLLPRPDLNKSLMFVQDFLADPKSQSGPGQTLCRKEWFKNTIQNFAVHARPGVGHSNGYAALADLPLPSHARAQDQVAAIALHRVHRI